MISQGYPLWIAAVGQGLIGRVIGWNEFPVVAWERDNGILIAIHNPTTLNDLGTEMLMPGLVLCDTRDEAIRRVTQ